jgi:L-ascorbate metabolism protein UlaG (beta-lactamase superfamily)
MANPILEKLLSARAELAICWLGNDGWLVRAQDLLIAFDLDLTSSARMATPPVSAEALAPALDVLFVTHEHDDHFSGATAAILAGNPRCTFVVPANCVEKARSLGISDARIKVARPRQPLDVLGLSVRPMRAIHGHKQQALYSGANLDDCGYLLTVAGRTLLQPGDSVLTEDHLALESVDILFVSPTIHNMHIEPASVLINTLKPRWIFPQHFGTYTRTERNSFWTVGYPEELRAALPPDLQACYHKLHQGDVFMIGGE